MIDPRLGGFRGQVQFPGIQNRAVPQHDFLRNVQVAPTTDLQAMAGGEGFDMTSLQAPLGLLGDFFSESPELAPITASPVFQGTPFDASKFFRASGLLGI